MQKILEISARNSKGGRRRIKMALLTIHSEGETNRNGISWKEEYVANNLDSIKGIPICASFLEEDKTVPYDHGYTDTVEIEDGKLEPLFNNSECCGVIEEAKIEDIEIDGVVKRVLVGYGFLFYQRYKNFVDYVKKEINDGFVKSSIEIVGKDGGNIVYDGEATAELRYPMIFDFSATAIISVKEADENCYVLEVAQQNHNEEDTKMEFDMNEIKSVIQSSIAEASDKTAQFEARVTELNNEIESTKAVVAERDNQIVELNASIEQLQKALNDMKAEHEAYWAEREILERELAKMRAEKRIAEMNEAISVYTEDEQKFAEVEINSFKEDPEKGDIDAIKAKICVGIVEKQKAEAAVAVEINSAKETVEVEDIFSEVCTETVAEEDEDINIF